MLYNERSVMSGIKFDEYVCAYVGANEQANVLRLLCMAKPLLIGSDGMCVAWLIT